MRHARNRFHVLLAAAPFALAFAPHASAAEPPRSAEPVDLEFLEFLGSDDDADAELREFVAAQPSTAKAPVSKAASDKPAPRTGSTTR